MTNAELTQVLTGEVRISYEHLMKPYTKNGREEAKYSCTLLIPKSDVATKQRIDAAIQKAIQDGVSSQWGGTRPPQPATPIWDGDGLRQNGEKFGPECAGCWVMTANSRQRQAVLDRNGDPIIDSTEVYSGMYARVIVNFFPYNSNGKRGIGAGLRGVQKLRDGEPLAGRVDAAAIFGANPFGAGASAVAAGNIDPITGEIRPW